jgi:hypothetical protein
LVGKKWRKRYYVLLQGGQFIEYENKAGKQLSFCKLSKGMSFHEYTGPAKEDGEIRSFQVMIPPDTDMILRVCMFVLFFLYVLLYAFICLF